MALRRALVLCLIAMTMLRGVVGDAMAMEMRLGHSSSQISEQIESATKSVAIYAQSAGAHAQFDTHEEAVQAKTPPCHSGVQLSQSDVNTNSHNCLLCVVCHLSSGTPVAPTLLLTAVVHQPPAQSVPTWHNAERAARFKPPVF